MCHPVRQVQTALARLRVGHAGVKAHLHRFNLADTSLCICGVNDTIEHFLLQCRRYRRERGELEQQLQKICVPLTLRNLLGGGDFSDHIQYKIINATAQYLVETKRITNL